MKKHSDSIYYCMRRLHPARVLSTGIKKLEIETKEVHSHAYIEFESVFDECRVSGSR
jgi:hypothetical protein